MREQINDRDERSDGVQTVSESMEPSCGHVEERGADIDAAARAVAHARLGGSAVDWLARTWPDAAFEWPTFWENWVDEFDASEASERRRRAMGSMAVRLERAHRQLDSTAARRVAAAECSRRKGRH